MKRELTITEIAASLEVSERTALRRIADGKLSVKKVGPNRYLVKSEDLENLAPRVKLARLAEQVQRLQDTISGQGVPSSPDVSLLTGQIGELAMQLSYQGEMIEALKSEVEALKDRVLTLEQATRKSRPVQRFVIEDVNYSVKPQAADKPRATPDDLPAGSITLAEMAQELGINRTTLLGHVRNEANHLEHIAIEKANRPGEYSRYFSPEQADVVRKWHAANTKKTTPSLWDEPS